MLLINKNSRPRESIYYTACCTLLVLKNDGPRGITDLHHTVSQDYMSGKLDYRTLQLSVNFLYLLGKVELSKEKIECI